MSDKWKPIVFNDHDCWSCACAGSSFGTTFTTESEAAAVCGLLNELEGKADLLALANMALSPERDAHDQYHDWHERLKAAARAAIAKAQA